MVWPSAGTGASVCGSATIRPSMHGIAHALARLQPRLLGRRQRVPFVVPVADDGRAVDFGQAVDMGDVEAHALHLLDHRRRAAPRPSSARRRGRRARGEFLASLGSALTSMFITIGAPQRWVTPCAAMACRDLRRRDPAQADMRAVERRHRPGKAPAVAVEHRQRPEIDRMRRHVPDQRVAERIQIGAAMMIDDALGIARRARGVVERDRLPFVRRQRPREIGIAAGEKGFVVRSRRAARRAARAGSSMSTPAAGAPAASAPCR